MKSQSVTNLLLLVIAIALVTIAAKPFLQPSPAHAEVTQPYPYYIEPGTQNLRLPDGNGQVLGRVVVDMRNGKIWGFPTNTLDPYPISGVVEAKPLTSHPFAMGRFAFEDADK